MTVDRRMIELYNEYVHTALPRREFLARLTRMAGGAAAAMTALAVLEPNYVQARQVEPDDKRPGVLVVHENRGLNEHIEDVARRTALAGYIAIAPDGLSVAGGAPEDQEAARDLFARQDPARIAGDVLAGVPWLKKNALCTGKTGAVGFCYGGGIALRAAIETPPVDAAVCFYGRQLSADE